MGSEGKAANEVHFLPHVQKCAGTALRAHLAEVLPTGSVRMVDSVTRSFLGIRWKQLVPPPEPLRSGIRVLGGHHLARSLKCLFPGRPVHESVLIRDPIGFLVSFYNFKYQTLRMHGIDAWIPFDTFYALKPRNYVSLALLERYFGVPAWRRAALSPADAFELLSHELQRFWFVGSHRHAEALGTAIAARFGCSGPVPRRNVTDYSQITPEALSPAWRDRILEENQLDLALFEAWGERCFGGEPRLAAGSHLSRKPLAGISATLCAGSRRAFLIAKDRLGSRRAAV